MNECGPGESGNGDSSINVHINRVQSPLRWEQYITPKRRNNLNKLLGEK